MATVAIDIIANDKTGAAFRSTAAQLETLGSSIDRLRSNVITLGGAMLAYFAADKLVAGFNKGIEAVDSFQQSVIKTAAMVTSLQGGENVAENYLKAKSYADGLQNTLMKIDANTTLNLTNLQSITEEMIKQGVVLDGNNAQQVDGFTRIANAVAVYSNNGRNEVQVRQEVAALLRGEVDQNSLLAGMLQKTVQGPLSEWVEKHKQAGDLMQALGEKLSGFGPASKDLAQTWGAVKSSLETSVSLILRAGFSAIVKDLVEWLGKANEYLKSHQELIGNKIKGAWEEFKKVAEFIVPILQEMFNHASLFVGLFVGGAFISGLTSAYGLFKNIRTVVKDIALIQAGSAVAGAAGAATGAGGTVAGGIAGAAAGWMAKARALPALKYLLNPVTAAVAAGAWVMGAKDTNNIDDMAKIKAFQPDTVASAAAPEINISDSQPQIKKKTDLMAKELAVFKEMEESKSAIAKAESDVQLTALKGRYEQGLVSTRDYYEGEKRLALDASQKKMDTTAAYYAKEQELLEIIKSKNGDKSAEYQDELAKSKKAQETAQLAALDYSKVSTDLNNKALEALKKRGEEYGKLQITALDSAGKYEEATLKQIDLDKQSIEYIRLKAEARQGEKGAGEALAAWEQKRSGDVITARNKEAEATRTMASEIQTLQSQLDVLNGKNQTLATSEKDLRDGKNTLLDLQGRLNLAMSNGNALAISGLSQQISLQSQLNQKKSEQLQFEQQVGVLNGTIVGFSGDTPIYADAYQRELAANGYQSAAAAVAAANNSTSASNNFINNNAFPSSLNSPFLGGFAIGTNYIPADGYAYLHEGEAVVPKQYNPAAGGAGTGTSITLQGGISITIQGGSTSQQTAADIARQVYPELQKLARHQKAA